MRRHAAFEMTFQRIARLVIGCTALALLAVPLEAQSHHARVARDIADRIAKGDTSVTEIIVAGSSGTLEALATRYGVTLKKRIQGGAVFEATGGQIDAIAQDPDVDHVAGNSPVYRMDAVTAQATGADQVWSGLDQLRGITGRGIGVAVVDSGIANHPALRDRVVASMDFTSGATPKTWGRDEYGHGTHVAGIVAESNRDGYPGMAPGP